MDPAATSEQIKLREFLELRITSLERLVQESDRNHAKALELQAREYERRLEQLNHAHEDARKKEQDFITRDTFEAYVHTTISRLEKIEVIEATHVDRDRMEVSLHGVNLRFDDQSKRISDIERMRANLEGRMAMFGTMLMGASLVVNLLLTIASHFIGRP